MPRIKRLGEVYSAGDAKVTLAGIYDFDPVAISYGYKYEHTMQYGLKRTARGWRMGKKECEGSITLDLDVVSDLERMFGDIALIRPFPINITFANADNIMIHDIVWAKFQGNKREVTNDGELQNEYELLVLDINLNVA